jgi:hypothetical protein
MNLARVDSSQQNAAFLLFFLPGPNQLRLQPRNQRPPPTAKDQTKTGKKLSTTELPQGHCECAGQTNSEDMRQHEEKRWPRLTPTNQIAIKTDTDFSQTVFWTWKFQESKRFTNTVANGNDFEDLLKTKVKTDAPEVKLDRVLTWDDRPRGEKLVGIRRASPKLKPH